MAFRHKFKLSKTQSLAIVALLAAVVSGWQINALWNSKIASSWPEVSGQVTSSKMVRRRARRRTRQAVVEYAYQVGDQSYRSKRTQFGDLSSFSFAGMDWTGKLARYPEGTSVQVKYNPQEPGKAVIETSLPMSNMCVLTLGIAATFFCGMSLIGSWNKSLADEHDD